jgi:hypothetical protein
MVPRLPRDGRLALLGLLVLLLAARPAAAGSLQALVPAYFYPINGDPNNGWNRMDAAAGQIKLTAILNPDSGPGPTQNSDYVTAVNNLEAAGGRILGYVYTQYGARSKAAVEADINTYFSFYHNINGIFFDQQSTNPAEVGYYHDLYNYVKGLNKAYEVIANPGTNTDPAYLSKATRTADALVTFEDTAANYATYTPAPWTSGYSADHFGNIVHTEPTAAGMLTDLQLAMQRNAGLVYVTDRTLPNPYDQLPSYWDQEVAAIKSSAVPEPAGVLLLAAGALSLLGWRNRRRAA